jgi:hypothetical protein
MALNVFQSTFLHNSAAVYFIQCFHFFGMSIPLICHSAFRGKIDDVKYAGSMKNESRVFFVECCMFVEPRFIQNEGSRFYTLVVDIHISMIIPISIVCHSRHA